MPIVMDMVWKDIRPEQYEAVRKLVNWEGNVPRGAICHVASFDQSGLHVMDVWESPEDFQRFVDDRLMPGVSQAGINSKPNVDIRPMHALFAPGLPRERATGD